MHKNIIGQICGPFTSSFFYAGDFDITLLLQLVLVGKLFNLRLPIFHC